MDPRRRARDGPRYVPALAFRALTPLYDPALRFFFDEPALKARLIRQAGLRGGQRVLDLGCGTGTLLLMLGESHPDCELWGLDGDRAVLARAMRKLAASGGRARLIAALGDRMPFRPGSFDRVLSSLFFHHLPSAIKVPVLEAALQALKPGGELHVLDFGRPSNIRTHAVFSFLRLFDGLDNTRDNARGLLPQRMAEAGFVDISEMDRVGTRVGTVTYCRAVRP
jgi:SAM-dependent methyltransferase